jgi:hypothetical protein
MVLVISPLVLHTHDASCIDEAPFCLCLCGFYALFHLKTSLEHCQTLPENLKA